LLMMSTVVMAAGAAAVLAVGTQDAGLLRLGLVAALWAALLGAFAAAQMRREASSSAEHAARLRSTYQLELEREVTARRIHTLTWSSGSRCTPSRPDCFRCRPNPAASTVVAPVRASRVGTVFQLGNGFIHPRTALGSTPMADAPCRHGTAHRRRCRSRLQRCKVSGQ
jgi:hypothetical protein